MDLETGAIYLWFAAILLIVAGCLGLWIAAFRTHWAWGLSFLLVLPIPLFVLMRFRRAWKSLSVIVVGILLLTGGMALAAYGVEKNLGERERIVDDERHLVLTGWNRGATGYLLLATKSDVVVLKMANADVDDSTLHYLMNYNKLRELDLNDTAITDAGLATLKHLPALENLDLRGTKITDEGFRKYLLPMESLKRLTLTDTAVTKETAKECQRHREEGTRSVGP